MSVCSRCEIMASVTSSVQEEPPRSGIRAPLTRASSRAASTRRPAFSWPACSRSREAAQIAPAGLATPSPAMSEAEPWMGSKSEENVPSEDVALERYAKRLMELRGRIAEEAAGLPDSS